MVLRSPDEAPFPLVPMRCRTRGVKGPRPTVGTGDGKDLLDVFAVGNVVTAALHTRTLESPAGGQRRSGLSQTRRLQAAFAQHLRDIARV